MYKLRKVGDSLSGDSGPMSMTLWIGNDETEYEHDARPEVGKAIRVGSYTARTMQYQDWWQTSYVTEILIDTPSYMKFKTENSVYEWWCNE